ncbi:MAG TPA: hypothetical protein VGL11_00690 [Candidatus Binatia bacterium]|jgi:hypothetical protein
MNVARSFPVFAITFAAAYAILYVASVEYNWALFTYHPALEEFGWFVEKPKEGPAMYWYGWLATSVLGALAIAGVASRLPAGWAQRVWPGLSWVVPVAVMLVFGYLLRGYFFR